MRHTDGITLNRVPFVQPASGAHQPAGARPEAAARPWNAVDTAGTCTQLDLLRGQTYCLHLRRGSLLSLRAGAVSVSSRVWLDSHSVAVRTVLHRGGVYRVQASEQLEIVAGEDARMEIVSAQGLLSLMACWVARLVSGAGK